MVKKKSIFLLLYQYIYLGVPFFFYFFYFITDHIIFLIIGLLKTLAWKFQCWFFSTFFTRSFICCAIRLQSLSTPVIKWKNKSFLKYSCVAHQKTRLVKLNTLVKFGLKNYNWSNSMHKLWVIEWLPTIYNFTAFSLPVQSIYIIFEDWFHSWVKFFNKHLLTHEHGYF